MVSQSKYEWIVVPEKKNGMSSLLMQSPLRVMIYAMARIPARKRSVITLFLALRPRKGNFGYAAFSDLTQLDLLDSAVRVSLSYGESHWFKSNSR